MIFRCKRPSLAVELHWQIEGFDEFIKQVQAVTVSDADRLEAEVELTEQKACRASEQGIPEIFGEDVFLNKLFRRASILNASFLNAVTNVLCTNLVVGKSYIDDDQSVEMESFFRDGDMYHTHCLYAEQADEEGERRGPANFDPTSRRLEGLVRAGEITGPNNSFCIPAINNIEFGPVASAEEPSLSDKPLFKRTRSAGIDPRAAHAASRAAAHDQPAAFAGFARTASTESNVGGSPLRIGPFDFSGFTRSKSADNDASHPYLFAGFTRTRSAESDSVTRLDGLAGYRPPRAGAAGHAVLEHPPAGQSLKGPRPAQWKLSRVKNRDYVRKLTLGASAEASLEFRKESGEAAPSDDSRTVLLCQFLEGSGLVAVHGAPVKSVARMRKKLLEYARAGDPWAGWPLTANILDPVRASIVCKGPRQLMQVAPFPRPPAPFPAHSARPNRSRRRRRRRRVIVPILLEIAVGNQSRAPYPPCPPNI